VKSLHEEDPEEDVWIFHTGINSKNEKRSL
jgi:hypothetical protein